MPDPIALWSTKHDLLESSMPGREEYRQWVKQHVRVCIESRCKVCVAYYSGFEEGARVEEGL